MGLSIHTLFHSKHLLVSTYPSFPSQPPAYYTLTAYNIKNSVWRIFIVKRLQSTYFSKLCILTQNSKVIKHLKQPIASISHNTIHAAARNRNLQHIPSQFLEIDEVFKSIPNNWHQANLKLQEYHQPTHYKSRIFNYPAACQIASHRKKTKAITHFRQQYMNARNPFSSLSNYSFIRNAQHLSSEGRSARTNSSHKKYFDYQGSYLRDSYLQNWELRRTQQQISSKLMGVEALRFVPSARVQEERGSPFSNEFGNNSKADYYNLQNYQTKDIQAEQPLAKIKSNSKLERHNALKESMYQSTSSHRAMKCSTKDMFGSDYFTNRCGTVQSEQERFQDDRLLKKSIFQKKEGNNASRFKVTYKEPKELWQLKEEQDEPRVKLASPVKQEQGEPETLFLKSRGKMFYLYHQKTY